MDADSAQAAPGDKPTPSTYIQVAEKATPLGVATLDANAKILSAQIPDLTATFVKFEVVERPQRFYAGHYDSLADVFAARDATNTPAIIELEPLTTYQAANLRIDKPDTNVKGEGAKITLPAGENQDVLRVGVNATNVKIEDVKLAGNHENQAGVSNGIVFEPYSRPDFRYSDVTKVVHVRIDGFKHAGVIAGEKRLHLVFDDVFIRDYGTIGIEMLASDTRFINGGLGGIRGQYGVKMHQGSNWVANCGIWSNTVAGIWGTEKANSIKILNNDIDNNLGGGIRLLGIGSSSLDATIMGNHFRGNSTEGEGLHSDIYLDQVSGVSLVGNRAHIQQGGTGRTKYVVEAGTGVDSVSSTGNDFATAYPILGRWNTAAAAARKNRVYGVDLIVDGSADVAIRRQGLGVEVTNDLTSTGTLLGQRHSITGVGGQGFAQALKQTATPSTPGPNAVREFYRDNGSGKIQKCAIFSSGTVQVLWTEA